VEERRRFGPGRGFGRREGGGFVPKPVEVGKEYEVDIQELSSRGEGIARVQGLVIFVAGTKPGDHVKIRVTRISRRFAEAEVVGKPEGGSEQEE
jgi:predicted RNA-binding protein with TRAM domain